MQGSSTSELSHALENVQALRWNWVVELVDQEELEEEWGACLNSLEQVRYHRSLSEVEEQYERSRWLRCRALMRHLNEFRSLTATAHALVLELSKANGQEILAERAGLSPLKRTKQPPDMVKYRPVYPPRKPAIQTIVYERQTGGPHVLGARLLWWLAAAEASENFGYTADFYHTLWTQPIWSVHASNTVKANEAVLGRITMTSNEVCRLILTVPKVSVAETRQAQPPANGPTPPNLFWWNGTSVELTDDQWNLVSFLWPRRRQMATTDEVIDRIWDAEVCSSTISAATSRLTKRFRENRIMESSQGNNS